MRVVQLMDETGWSLARTPPPNVLRAMLEAPDIAAQEQLLLNAEAGIVEDLDLLNRSLESPRFGDLHDAAVQALASYSSGYFIASQALSTAALTSAIHNHFGLVRFKAARNRQGVRPRPGWPPSIPFRERDAGAGNGDRPMVAHGSVSPPLQPAKFRPCSRAPQYRQVNALYSSHAGRGDRARVRVRGGRDRRRRLVGSRQFGILGRVRYPAARPFSMALCMACAKPAST